MKPLASALTLCLALALPLSATLRFETKKFSKTAESSIKDVVGILKLEWPHITAGVSPELAGKLNALIQARILAALEAGGKPFASPEALFAEFSKAFLDSLKDSPLTASWGMDRILTVAQAPNKTCSVTEAWYAYTGGAHPNSSTTHHVFMEGKGRLKLEDLCLPGKLPALVKAGEPLFRKARNIPAGESFGQHGFWLDDGFKLNQNFRFTGDGLEFCFNPYEIGPYVLGATTFTIPWAALKAILRPELLARGK